LHSGIGDEFEYLNKAEEWVSDGLVGDDEFLLGTATAAHFLSLVVPESKSAETTGNTR
jgi:hypothetical protein